MRKVFAIFLLSLFLPAFAIDEEDIDRALSELEEILEHQPEFERKRKNSIAHLRAMADVKPTPERLLAVGEAYIGFNNDSSISYLSYGLSHSRGSDRSFPLAARRTTASRRPL